MYKDDFLIAPFADLRTSLKSVVQFVTWNGIIYRFKSIKKQALKLYKDDLLTLARP